MSLHQKTTHGFTLLEMLVSLAIFTVVAVFAVGSLVRITGLNRQAQTLQSAMNNLSFGLESISREMRVGSGYSCYTNSTASSFVYTGGSLPLSTCDLTQGGQLIAFYSSHTASNSGGGTCHLVIAYRFKPYGSNWELQKAQQQSCSDTLDVNLNFYDVVDPNLVNISGLELGVFRDATTKFANAFIRLTGYAGTRVQDQNTFDIETSIADRLHD